MEKAIIRLVVLDVDGTMIDSPKHRTLSPELCATIKQVADTGVQIGLASGRNYGHIMSQMRAIGFNGPIISNNGAYVVMNGKTVHETLLNTHVIDAIIRQAVEYQYMVEFSGRDVMYTYQPPEYTGPVFPKIGTDNYLDILDGTDADFTRMRSDYISKITMIMDTEEKARKVQAFWENGPMAQDVSLSQSFWFCLELTAPGVTKGAALQRTAAALNIPMSQVLAIGDGDNDAEMLEAAGISFVMANGSKKACLVAKYMAPHVREDGARQVLERHILRSEPLPPLKTN